MNEDKNQYPRMVWINEEDKIVSFHPVRTYEEKVLFTREEYISFIFCCVNSEYRFQ